MLYNQGYPVPEPIVNSGNYQGSIEGVSVEWTVTREIGGEAIKKQRLPNPVARELGQMLCVLHSIPVSGFGRLAERKDVLCGLQSDEPSGLLARWCWAKLWPLDSSALIHHPIAMLAPRLLDQLGQIEADLIDACQGQSVCLVHTDLHGEHIFTMEERLTGLIDFGAAFVGGLAWDFASLAFYHGWTVVHEALGEYSSSINQRADYLEQTEMLVLVLSLYKLDKAVTDGAPTVKIDRIVGLLIQTLKNLLK